MSEAISAYGTLVERSAANNGSYTTVSELESVSFDFSADVIDVSTMSSPNNWKEYISGMKDGGEFNCSHFFVPTNATQSASSGLLLDFKNRTKRDFRLKLPDAGPTYWPFSGIVTKFGFNAKHDDALRCNYTIKVTGEPTLNG